jgi:hypothetical protein
MEYPTIWTSAYWHPGVARLANDGKAVPVGITLYRSRREYGVKVGYRITELAPNRAIFSNKGLSPEEFESAFAELLVDRWEIAEEKLLFIASSNPGKDLILLCWENVAEGAICHRTQVARFIENAWERDGGPFKISELSLMKEPALVPNQQRLL